MKKSKTANYLVLDRAIGAYEAKTHLSDLLAEVEQTGVSITITKNNRPVARLVPIASGREGRVDSLVDRMRTARKGVKLKSLSIRQLIEEGRRF